MLQRLLFTVLLAGLACGQARAQRTVYGGVQAGYKLAAVQASVTMDSVHMDVFNVHNRWFSGVEGEWPLNQHLTVKATLNRSNNRVDLRLVNTLDDRFPWPEGTGGPLNMHVLRLGLTPTFSWQLTPMIKGYVMAGLGINMNHKFENPNGLDFGPGSRHSLQLLEASNNVNQMPRRFFYDYSLGGGITVWRFYVQALETRTLGNQLYKPMKVLGGSFSIPSHARFMYIAVGYKHPFTLGGKAAQEGSQR